MKNNSTPAFNRLKAEQTLDKIIALLETDADELVRRREQMGDPLAGRTGIPFKVVKFYLLARRHRLPMGGSAHGNTEALRRLVARFGRSDVES